MLLNMYCSGTRALLGRCDFDQTTTARTLSLYYYNLHTTDGRTPIYCAVGLFMIIVHTRAYIHYYYNQTNVGFGEKTGLLYKINTYSCS